MISQKMMMMMLTVLMMTRTWAFGSWNLPSLSPWSSTKDILKLEADAVAAAKNDDNAALLKSIEALEKAKPSAETLLDDVRLARQLNGAWLLAGTLAATIGEPLEETGRRNVVNASGFSVDASEKNKPLQTIDVDAGRIMNEVKVQVPFFENGSVRVSGSLRRGDNARRAEVEFDTLEFLDGKKTVFKNSWLFKVARSLRPTLFTGNAEETAWLETTYLSDNVRVGRGNKGSCFLLERVKEDE